MTAAVHAARTKSVAKLPRACVSQEDLKKFGVTAQTAVTAFERLSKSPSKDPDDSKVKQALREGGLVRTVPLTSAAEEVTLGEMLRDSNFINLIECPTWKSAADAGKLDLLPNGAVLIYKIGDKTESAIKTASNCDDTAADNCAVPLKKKYLGIYVK
jgi:hypothetical protein